MRLLKTLVTAAAILATSFPAPASAQSTADLSVSLVGVPDPVVRGKTITWTITVRNLGPGQATGVLLVAAYGSDGSPVSATTTQGACTLTGDSVDFSLGSISSGGEATATVAMQAFGGDGGFLFVEASSTTSDPSRGNNRASGSIGITPGPPSDQLGGTFCPPSGGVATGGGGTIADAQAALDPFGLLALAGLVAAAVLRFGL
ncbi:MAG: DUF11 domain-containing protein [Actinomycetota bacterium]